MNRIALLLVGFTLWVNFHYALAGDTYACINSKGDYYSPGPNLVNPNTAVVIAYDSSQHEPRWRPMLSETDQRRLIFIEARTRAAIAYSAAYRGF